MQFGTTGAKCCGVRHCRGWARQGHFAIGTSLIRCHGHCRDTVEFGTAGRCRTSLRLLLVTAGKNAVIGHCRHTVRLTLWLHTAGILCVWALQGYSAVGHCRDTWCLGHCRDTLRLGTTGILLGWGIAGIFIGQALQGYSAVGHGRDNLRLGTAGILCGWALQG